MLSMKNQLCQMPNLIHKENTCPNFSFKIVNNVVWFLFLNVFLLFLFNRTSNLDFDMLYKTNLEVL
jgi:hypothetical protein